MKGFIRVVVIVLALCTFCNAQGGVLGNIFGGRRNPLSVQAKDCFGSKCGLDLSTLDFADQTDSISFDLKGNGRTIQCDKHVGRYNLARSSNSWVGRCGNLGTAHLITRGTNSRGEKLLYGSVVDNDTQEICQFSPDAQGNNEVKCIPIADFPPFEEPSNSLSEQGATTTPLNDDNDTVAEALVADPFLIDEFVSSTSTKRNPGLKGSRTDDSHRDLNVLGSELDIMVVWTRNAECRASGLPNGCNLTHITTENIKGQIEASILETNQAYSNSGIQTELRLVRAYRDPSNYNEVAKSYSQILNEATNTTDDIMDDIHVQRSKYGADIVALVVSNPAACGIGWYGPALENMFSVNYVDCFSGLYVIAHEVGHNMGCDHDRGTKINCAGSGYNYGFIDPDSRFRTIMSYPCSLSQRCGTPAGDCTLIPYFSSSDESIRHPDYNAPIGNGNTDNARVIKESLEVIAGYYPSKNLCEEDADCPNDDQACREATCDEGVCLYTATVVEAQVNVVVDILTDNYPGETTWSLSDGCSTVASGGPYGLQGTIYSYEVLVPVGPSYTFTINDQWGDGICCGYGIGNYNVTRGGELVADGGQFGASEATSFATSATATTTTEPPETTSTSTSTTTTEATTTSTSTTTTTPAPTPFPTPLPTPFPTPQPVTTTTTSTSTSTTTTTLAPTPFPTPQPTPAPTPQPTSAPTPQPVTTTTTTTTTPEPMTTSTTTEATTTTQSAASCPSGEVEVTIDILTDNYPRETSWTLNDGSTTVASGGSFIERGTTYSEEVCVPIGPTYEFVINDSWGDGICCGYGNGGYNVTRGDEVVASGGEFGTSETKEVSSCVNVKVEIVTDNYPGETTFELKDIANQVILSGGPYSATGTTYVAEVECVPVGRQYEFVIYDSFGDGICCGYGDGGYNVTCGGQTVESDGEFGREEIKVVEC